MTNCLPIAVENGRLPLKAMMLKRATGLKWLAGAKADLLSGPFDPALADQISPPCCDFPQVTLEIAP